MCVQKSFVLTIYFFCGYEKFCCRPYKHTEVIEIGMAKFAFLPYAIINQADTKNEVLFIKKAQRHCNGAQNHPAKKWYYMLPSLQLSR